MVAHRGRGSDGLVTVLDVCFENQEPLLSWKICFGLNKDGRRDRVKRAYAPETLHSVCDRIFVQERIEKAP
jgi:hypothetical protein